MSENENTGSLGRKIFFLYPSALVQNQVITELAQEEFEVYVAKDETKLRQVLKKYPDSIVFASINEGMKEKAWDDWILAIRSAQASVDIGILGAATDDAEKRKYVELMGLRLGYITVKSDFTLVTKQAAAVLNAVNAKGRRKYVRLLMDGETNATINLPMNGTFVNGVIKDISVVGFSCVFTDDPQLAKNVLVSDIQIRLQTQLLKAEGIVFGSRMVGEEKHYVVLFTQRIDPAVRTKIRKYIQTILQTRIDAELK